MASRSIAAWLWLGGIYLSAKLFKNLICQVKEIINLKFGIMDEWGVIISCSDETWIGKSSTCLDRVEDSREHIVILDGFAYQKVYIKNKLEFITFIEYCDETSLKYLSLITVNVVNIKTYHDEKFDRNSFLKSILMGSIPIGDIALRAKELHIAHNAIRTVFIIRTEKIHDVFVYETIQGLFPNRSRDFIIVLDDENTVLIKELKINEEYKEIEKTAKNIVDTLNTETMVRVMVGIGTVVDSIADIGRCYKEAQTALTVGTVFEKDKLIFYYNNLGLGRLIYQLPEGLCRLFLKEVFKEGSFEALDAEYLTTIQKFFENNLNVSETSRQMFVHRNTLVYRLDKIKKITGLDLTQFDDAIIFKFAMLIKRYLDKGASKDVV